MAVSVPVIVEGAADVSGVPVIVEGVAGLVAVSVPVIVEGAADVWWLLVFLLLSREQLTSGGT